MPPPTIAALKRHKKRADYLKAKIGGAKSQNLRKKAALNYLRSFSSKVVALEMARLKLGMPAKDVDWNACAEKLDLCQPGVKEPVRLVAQDKETATETKHRFTFDFGLWHRARQILLKTCLDKIHTPHPAQYLHQGGRDVAVEVVRKNYAEGLHFVAELDLNSAFHSFGTKETAEFLGLPEAVVDTTLSGSSLKVVPSTSISQIIAYDAQHHEAGMSKLDVIDVMMPEWRRALEGLTEGNCASPVACEMLLAWVCEKLPHDWPNVRLVNYADNFLVMATSAEDVQHAVVLLREYLSEHPAAPPNTPITATVDFAEHGKPFPFLGYWLVPQAGDLRVEISNRGRAKLKDLRRKARKKIIAKNTDPTSRAEMLNDVWRKQRAVVSGYRLWEAGNKQIISKTRKIYTASLASGLDEGLLDKSLKFALQQK